VRQVFGSIFVKPCMYIFRGYVSVDEYVCVDRCEWIGFVDPCMCILRGYFSVNEYVCVDRFAWISVRGSLAEIPVLWISLCGSMCMDRGVLFAWGIHLCGSVCMICLGLFCGSVYVYFSGVCFC